MNHKPLSPRPLAAFSLAVLIAACSSSPPPPSSTADAGPSVPGGHVAIGQLPDIDMSAVLAHTKVLSSDEFEGRLPGTEGKSDRGLSRRSVQEGGTEAGQHRRHATSRRCRWSESPPRPAPLVVKKDAEEQTLKWRDEVVAWTKHVAPDGKHRRFRAGLRRLRSGRARVQLGRLQGRGREGQNARHARQRSAGRGRV